MRVSKIFTQSASHSICYLVEIISVLRGFIQISLLEKLFDKLFTEIDGLKSAMNRGRGVFAASLSFAGLVGAAVTAAIDWFHK